MYQPYRPVKQRLTYYSSNPLGKALSVPLKTSKTGRWVFRIQGYTDVGTKDLGTKKPYALVTKLDVMAVSQNSWLLFVGRWVLIVD